jgi:DNA-binding beta-propeller fold protein YncE
VTACAASSLAILAGLAGCGRAGHHLPRRLGPTSAATPAQSHRSTRSRVRRAVAQPSLQAVVTDESEGRLLVVDLRSGRVLRRISVPGDPGYVATIGSGGPVVVASSAAGTVTLVGGTSLHVIKVLHGFADPDIPAMAPGGGYAYVTEDGPGQVAVILLADDKIVSRNVVGAGAHHLAFSPNLQQVWVALGESASTIAILSTVVRRPPPPFSVVADPGHPRLVGQFRPGYLAHDLLFTPNGRQVWITSANGPMVGVFSARTRRLLFRVPGGPPPQHVVFDGPYAYVTSGYGSRIEQVSITTGRVLKRVAAPYGSFDLDAAGGYVVTSSLLRGTLAIYNTRLRLLRVRRVASSAEDVILYQP